MKNDQRIIDNPTLFPISDSDMTQLLKTYIKP